jgi:hypothetical protein
LPENLSSESSLREFFFSFVPPQELRHSEVVRRRIQCGTADGLKVDGPALTFHRTDNTPPPGDAICHIFQVKSSNNHGHSVENGAVSLGLFDQSAQGVVVAFYLVAVEKAVDNRDIGPASPVLQAQFIDYERVGSRMVSSQVLAVETRTYLGIVHGTVLRRLWAI